VEERSELMFARRLTTPLDAEQMKVLIGLLKVSIAETEQHIPALKLIKAIMSHQFVSAEFYDLMESLVKLVVRSQKANLRQHSATLFIRYLLDYPMSEQRFQEHMQQVVANVNYEYQEGRLSGISLLGMIIEKVPQELLEKHAQMLFLSLVLQLVNDGSKDCRERLSNCLVLLLERSSTELLLTFEEYCGRWGGETGPLRLASLQVFGILAETRPDFLRKNALDAWIERLEESLYRRHEKDWEITYFSLVSIEKLSQHTDFQFALLEHSGLWSSITQCLTEQHPWIKMSACRILEKFFSSATATTVLARKDGLLFDIVRNLCFQLNSFEEQQNEDLSNLAVKNLSLALPLMKEHPRFCYVEDELEDGGAAAGKKDPVFWLLRRLSQIAKNKGGKRRLAVFKCYGAFASRNFEIIAPHLELILEGLHRTITEGRNELENHALSQKRKSTSSIVQHRQQRDDRLNSSDSHEYSMAEDVLRLLEESCTSPDQFLAAYAAVKRRSRDKKWRRKIEEKAEAITNPQAAAERKIKKQERNKQRRKRRAEEHRVERGGGEKKRRH
jgi:U3 small nucleolar RNA-associated protein 20